MITGSSELGFFGPKMAVSWRITVFQKTGLLETLFLQCFGGARFLGQAVKRGNFGTPKIKTENFDW